MDIAKQIVDQQIIKIMEDNYQWRLRLEDLILC
jgi:hypothetical protein